MGNLNEWLQESNVAPGGELDRIREWKRRVDQRLRDLDSDPYPTSSDSLAKGAYLQGAQAAICHLGAITEALIARIETLEAGLRGELKTCLEVAMSEDD